ncbi:MAG: trypsin-like peptidase domain-containing protein [Planctomycetes bacterium]|nr:trypsin-like peptidase domain-containing protein [Planctomycetota bacterium]
MRTTAAARWILLGAALILATGGGLAAYWAWKSQDRVPTLTLGSSELVFQHTEGDSRAPVGTLRVLSAGPAPFTVESGVSWLAVAPSSGTAPADVTVTAALSLGAGTHTGRIVVRDVRGEATVVPVVVVVARREAPKEDRLAPEVLERVRRATVFITCRYRPIERTDPYNRHRVSDDDQLVGCGTGFFLNSEGLLLTNEHVVSAVRAYDPKKEPRGSLDWWAARQIFLLESVTVRIYSGTGESREYPAQVLCTRPFPLDLALVRVQGGGPFEFLPGIDPNEEVADPPVGAPVWSVGFPMGLEMEAALLSELRMTPNPNGPDISLRSGTVSCLRRDAGGRVKAVEHTCPIEPGNSGGPLVDSRGRLFGINSFGLGEEGKFAIPQARILDEIRPALYLNGCRKPGSSIPSRTLRVDPADAKPDISHKHDEAGSCRAAPEGAFATIEEAVRDSHSGDILRLAAGTHRLTKPLFLPHDLRLHGAGRDRTTIAGGLIVSPERNGSTEISDLTIGRFEPGELALMVLGGSQALYFHDLSIDGSIRVGNEDSPGGDMDLVRADVRLGMEVLKQGHARVESTRFGNRIVVQRDAAVELLGCTSLRTMASVLVTQGGRLRASGFVGGAHIQGGEAVIDDSFAFDTFAWEWKVSDGGRAEWGGCSWSLLGAVSVEGSGSQASFVGNQFQGGYEAVRVSDGARADLERNVIRCSNLGVAAVGAGSMISLRGNLFVGLRNTQWFHRSGGGEVRDGGGNLTKTQD